MNRFSLGLRILLVCTACVITALALGQIESLPKFKRGQFVYTIPKGYEPEGVGKQGIERIQETLKRFPPNYPYYVVLVNNLPGGSDEDASELIHRVQESWAGQPGYRMDNGCVFLLSFNPRKYRFQAGSRWDTELHFSNEAHKPYTDIFLQYAKRTPRDPVTGMIEMAISVKNYLVSANDPVKRARELAESQRLHAQAKAEFASQERARKQAELVTIRNKIREGLTSAERLKPEFKWSTDGTRMITVWENRLKELQNKGYAPDLSREVDEARSGLFQYEQQLGTWNYAKNLAPSTIERLRNLSNRPDVNDQERTDLRSALDQIQSAYKRRDPNFFASSVTLGESQIFFVTNALDIRGRMRLQEAEAAKTRASLTLFCGAAAVVALLTLVIVSRRRFSRRVAELGKRITDRRTAITLISKESKASFPRQPEVANLSTSGPVSQSVYQKALKEIDEIVVTISALEYRAIDAEEALKGLTYSDRNKLEDIEASLSSRISVDTSRPADRARYGSEPIQIEVDQPTALNEVGHRIEKAAHVWSELCRAIDLKGRSSLEVCPRKNLDEILEAFEKNGIPRHCASVHPFLDEEPETRAEIDQLIAGDPVAAVFRAEEISAIESNLQHQVEAIAACHLTISRSRFSELPEVDTVFPSPQESPEFLFREATTRLASFESSLASGDLEAALASGNAAVHAFDQCRTQIALGRQAIADAPGHLDATQRRLNQLARDQAVVAQRYEGAQRLYLHASTALKYLQPAEQEAIKAQGLADLLPSLLKQRRHIELSQMAKSVLQSVEQAQDELRQVDLVINQMDRERAEYESFRRELDSRRADYESSLHRYGSRGRFMLSDPSNDLLYVRGPADFAYLHQQLIAQDEAWQSVVNSAHHAYQQAQSSSSSFSSSSSSSSSDSGGSSSSSSSSSTDSGGSW